MSKRPERRAHPRLQEKHKVTVTITACPDEPELEGRQFSGRTRNLSTGGFQFIARRSFPIGTRMHARLECTRPYEELDRDVRVVWCQESSTSSRPVVGVYFSDESREKAIEWRRMLARRVGR